MRIETLLEKGTSSVEIQYSSRGSLDLFICQENILLSANKLVSIA